MGLRVGLDTAVVRKISILTGNFTDRALPARNMYAVVLRSFGNIIHEYFHVFL